VIHFVDDPRQVINRAREVHPTVFIGVPRFYEKLVDGFSERIESFPGGLVSRFLKRALAQAKRNREGETKSFFRAWESWFWDILLFRPFRNLLGGKVKILFTGSAPMPPRLLEFIQAAGMNLLEGYAMSENTVPVTVNRTGAKRLGSVGQVLLPNEVQLAEDGEILVRGPGLFSGYWKSETTEGWFTEDGFFRTGDLGWMDDKGFLFLKGRKDEVIKTSTGRKISPSRLETVYGASPYFDRVVVIGNNRPGPLALLWLKKNQNPSSMEISHETHPAGNVPSTPTKGVHHFVLPKEDLDISQGTLTPSLKLKRRVIEDRFRSEGGILLGAGEPEPIKTPASRVSWFEALKRFMAPVKLFFVVHVIERIFLRRLSREFYLLIGGAIHFQALSSAVRFDLFTLLDTHGPLKEDQIAERLGLVEQPAKILLLSLVATGLLKKSGDQYRNSWVAQHYLSQRSPKNISKIILWQHFINYRPMYHFHESLIKNTNVGLQLLDGTERTLYERLTHHPDLEMIFQEAMGQISVQANDLLSQFPGFQSVHRLLDVGGGNGSNIIQLASRHPHLKATVFDSASVCAIARTNIHQKGLSDRLGDT
jgi:predicted transcriptional regulator